MLNVTSPDLLMEANCSSKNTAIRLSGVTLQSRFCDLGSNFSWSAVRPSQLYMKHPLRCLSTRYTTLFGEMVLPSSMRKVAATVAPTGNILGASQLYTPNPFMV